MKTLTVESIGEMVARRNGHLAPRAPLAGNGTGHGNGNGNGHGAPGAPRRPSTLTDVVTVSGHVQAHLAPGRGGFLFDATSGHIYFLNKTSAFIFERLVKRCKLLDIVRELGSAYDVNESTALSDTMELLYQLRDFGLGKAVESD